MIEIPKLEFSTRKNGDEAECQILFQDNSKKVLIPSDSSYKENLEKLRKSDAFQAAQGSVQFVRFGGQDGAEHVLFAGAGAEKSLKTENLRILGGNVYAKVRAEKIRSVAIDLSCFVFAKDCSLTTGEAVRAFAEGLLLPAYEFDKYKSDLKKPDAAPVFRFVSEQKNATNTIKTILAEVESAAEAISLTRGWSNEPSNFGTPTFYADEAQKIAKKYGLKCRVLSQKECKKEKMNLFLAVSQGSVQEAKVVVLEYAPKGAKKTVALVGKGITFDSGGISIKPALRMEEMKHDMTGAATVLGATVLASLWKVPHRVVAVMAFCENMPDGGAIQPGNVVKARSGKTVEILNTDAEGRLILADALDYAQEIAEPDAMINVATLTGACSIALGRLCCAVLGNDQSTIDSVRRAGEKNGERAWQLPLFDEYLEDLKSPVADLRNVANDSYGGTIRGGMFLKQFVKDKTKWAHLDIASTAADVPLYSYIPKKGATGFYVRTLAQFVRDF